MHVNKIANGAITTDALQRAQGSGSVPAPVEPAAPVRGADAVQISDAGLALSGSQTDPSSATALDPSRADQIRAKILSGAYNSLGMADQVARAVMRSGDL
jgi:hypothetical protein